jgi:DNA replication protein DnaC
MDKLQTILAGLNFTGHTSEPLSPAEMEQFRADSFNTSEGSLNQEDDYNCSTCRNKGLIMKAVEIRPDYWSTTSSECKCMGVRRTIKRMQRSGLKNIIRDYTFQKFDASQDWQQTIKNAAVGYAKAPAGWFFIGGQSGAGKTHICTAICREFLLSGKVVKYMLWRDEIIKIKNAVNEGEEYTSLIDSYKKTPILYVDDLFKTGKAPDGSKQKPTAADVNVAFEILNYRYNDPALMTIISSECTINDILDIDEAVGGRIFERAKTAFSLKPDRSRNYRLKGVVEL